MVFAGKCGTTCLRSDHGAARVIPRSLGGHSRWMRRRECAANRANVEKAEGERQRLQAQQELTETVVNVQARNAASALAAAESITDIRLRSSRMARAWLSAAESIFNLGLCETRDLVEAFEAYVVTRGALLEAVYRENVARAEFDFAKGGG